MTTATGSRGVKRAGAAPSVRTHRAQIARDVVLSVLAIVSVGIGLYQLTLPERVDLRMTTLDWIDLAIVALFWVDLALEVRRWGSFALYVKKHWWELPSLIPAVPAVVAILPAAGLLRALRLLRLVRVVSVLMRLRPAGAYLVRLARRAHLDAIFAIAAGIVLVATLVAYALESRANPDMASMGQALWFAINMFTNVAYLDFQPVTTGGRVLAAILQVCGIAFIGIFTASLAGAIVREDPDAE